ncbi:pentapeptide repeat-containing protein [Paenibacillus sp. Marseille-Q4541]|uniref:pentapeptide repeat-containing protein n=1 Tax=Paenibacillus sp. Marseille-Q4541 TaxID=2831522 RepID=UPI001BAA2A80|nr:pentapeptide repeat-containing protein [Paenibacillus sp. Marseille-Q4541]
MEQIELVNTTKILDVKNACLDGSRFICAGLERIYFENVSFAGTIITDANLSNLEIDGAQLGGAYIHNIGMPPEGHPNYHPEAKQNPIRFENCNLEGSEITNCNLTDLQINDCNVDGMKINGVLVSELLREYEKSINA